MFMGSGLRTAKKHVGNAMKSDCLSCPLQSRTYHIVADWLPLTDDVWTSVGVHGQETWSR